jgi:hypothetical protein
MHELQEGREQLHAHERRHRRHEPHEAACSAARTPAFDRVHALQGRVARPGAAAQDAQTQRRPCFADMMQLLFEAGARAAHLTGMLRNRVLGVASPSLGLATRVTLFGSMPAR